MWINTEHRFIFQTINAPSARHGTCTCPRNINSVSHLKAGNLSSYFNNICCNFMPTTSWKGGKGMKPFENVEVTTTY
jgi:hypothetical protein